MNNKRAFLDLPDSDSVIYERNLIDIVVCELRFPTLLELERKAPEQLQKKLRKKYPYFETQERAEFNNSENLPGHYRYLFRSKSQNWTVTIHSNGISLETSAYVDFEDFFERLCSVVELSKSIIDSDFFTRVGLRYVNTIPIEDGMIDKWLTPCLIGGLTPEPFGTVDKYVSEIKGSLSNGKYTFRHGVKSIEQDKIKEYFLDFDYFSEDVEYDDAVLLVKEFNKTNFAFFNWCLGQKAKDFLGEGEPKKGNK